MRKMVDMKIVSYNTSGSAWDYRQECSALVSGGYTPYGKPYTNGNTLFREFVKYEYTIDEGFSEEWEEDEQIVPEDPWETHDFFEHMEREFEGE